MKYSPVSNHYAQLALIGVAALVGYGWTAATRLRPGSGRASLAILAVGVAGGFGWLTWKQCRIYADAGTLYRDTVARNPHSWLGHCNLGVVLLNAGRIDLARAQLEERRGAAQFKIRGCPCRKRSGDSRRPFASTPTTRKFEGILLTPKNSVGRGDPPFAPSNRNSPLSA